MSSSSPPPPPLPPPTVPARPRSSPQRTPPPIEHTPPRIEPTPSLSALLEKATAPPLTSVASSAPHSVSAVSVVDQTEHPSEILSSSLTDPFPKKKPPPPPRTCSPFRPPPHHVHEPARSLLLDTRALLIFRLAATAILLATLIFFSLRGDFSYRLYSTWNLVGLVLAFFLVLLCSLLDILRDEDAELHDGNVQGEAFITDVEQQPLHPPHPPDPKLARPLTRFAIPIYQVFVTATLFGTIVYWAAVHDSTIVSFSIPLIFLKVVTPAFALMDLLLSLRMRFRFLYVLLYVLYNAIYAAALIIFDKVQGLQVYLLFDRSLQTQQMFIAKSAGISAGSVVWGLLMYFLANLPVIRCGKGSWKGTSKAKPLVEEASDTTPTMVSDDTSDSSKPELSKGADKLFKSDLSEGLDLQPEKEEDARKRGIAGKRDRTSIPLSASAKMASSSSAKWVRSASARIISSRSGSSIGSDDERASFPRSASDRPSTWDSMESAAAKVEDEYFAMPAVNVKREVIKLEPIQRNESESTIAGLLSRSSSGRMSRSGSRRMSRAGSGRSLFNS